MRQTIEPLANLRGVFRRLTNRAGIPPQTHRPILAYSSPTDDLLTVTADLKRQIDKTTPGTLSIDLIKKAGEIEKLAHSVKERLKG